MSRDEPSPLADLSPSRVDRIFVVCARFETARRRGDRPRIEDLLGDCDEALRPTLMRKSLATELQCRRRTGERPTLDAYPTRFPDLPEAVATVFCEGSPSAIYASARVKLGWREQYSDIASIVARTWRWHEAPTRWLRRSPGS
jgi:hypothetical protein